jgi:hypothetical protein
VIHGESSSLSAADTYLHLHVCHLAGGAARCLLAHLLRLKPCICCDSTQCGSKQHLLAHQKRMTEPYYISSSLGEMFATILLPNLCLSMRSVKLGRTSRLLLL